MRKKYPLRPLPGSLGQRYAINLQLTPRGLEIELDTVSEPAADIKFYYLFTSVSGDWVVYDLGANYLKTITPINYQLTDIRTALSLHAQQRCFVHDDKLYLFGTKFNGPTPEAHLQIAERDPDSAAVAFADPVKIVPDQPFTNSTEMVHCVYNDDGVFYIVTGRYNNFNTPPFQVLKSADLGLTWTRQRLFSYFSGGTRVALALHKTSAGLWGCLIGGTQDVLHSTDGANWTLSTSNLFTPLPNGRGFFGMFNDVFFVAGEDGGFPNHGQIAYSTDLINWSSAGFVANELGDMDYALNLYVTATSSKAFASGAYNGVAGFSSLVTSVDGSNWVNESTTNMLTNSLVSENITGIYSAGAALWADTATQMAQSKDGGVSWALLAHPHINGNINFVKAW